MVISPSLAALHVAAVHISGQRFFFVFLHGYPQPPLDGRCTLLVFGVEMVVSIILLFSSIVFFCHCVSLRVRCVFFFVFMLVHAFLDFSFSPLPLSIFFVRVDVCFSCTA